MNLSPAAAKDRREIQYRLEDNDELDDDGKDTTDWEGERSRNRRAEWWARAVKVVVRLMLMVDSTADG